MTSTTSSSTASGDPAVLVIGAGPVGLLLGCELARRGVALRIVDKLPRPTTESRAIVVHARSLEMLERVGVVDEIMAAGVKTTGMAFHADGGAPARTSFETVDSPYPFSVTLPQTETERILAERLTALGVETERGVELVDVEQDADGVRSRVRHPDGREETIASAWIVGTDGSRSTVRHQLGTALEGSFAGEAFLMADAEADYELDRSTIHTFFSSGSGPLMVFPMLGDRVRIIAQTTEETADHRDPTLREMQEIVDQRAGEITLREAHWLTRFEIHHAQVRQYRHGRAFLAGDAAHVHSPAGAQGMNTGMQDAFNLGWKLALAASGGGTEELLDSYHAERHPVAARVIAETTRITTLSTLSRPIERAVRNRLVHLAVGIAPLRRKIADEAEETDIRYRDSPIVVPARHRLRGPQPGDVAPDAPGAGDAPLHAVLAAGTGHTLLQFGPAIDAPPAVATPLRRVLVSPRPVESRGFDAMILDTEREIARRYGVEDGDAAFVIRPDGYIGARTDTDRGPVDAYADLVLTGAG